MHKSSALPTELTSLTLAQACSLLQKGAVSPVELTQACLRRIERLDPALNAFITKTPELATEQAQAAENEIRRGSWRGPLHGVPIALKDLVDTAGVKTTAASAVFEARVPQQDAEVVRRLRNAGAVLIGKTNLHEFAYGGSGMVSHFGVTRNPWSQEHITGGSSSGSAAAVAAGMSFGALGSDTAGSIRLPAALCGMVGLKPTYGLVSVRGVIPLAWSYDHLGPMARTVEDAAILLESIAGYDPDDVNSRELSVGQYREQLDGGLKGIRAGVAREFFFEDLDAEVQALIEGALKVVGELTSELREITVPVDNDRTVHVCEAWTYHASLVAEHADRYQPETLRRIRSGEGKPTEAYIQKQRELEMLRRSAGRIFEQLDVVITPTSPVPAPTISELQQNADDLRRRELILLRNTRPFNVLGLPAISIPCGFTRTGMPVGLQIAGAAGADGTVLRVAHAYEQATRWHERRPQFD